jgi:LemA protein
MPLLILIGILAVVGLWAMFAYNRLVSLRNETQNGWRQIDVQLKRRHDLIPNLVNTVTGAMEFERNTLTAVMDARARAMTAAGPADAARKEGELGAVLGRLLAVTENYPQLKANDNVKQLQEELTATENKIAFSRQFYNDSVNAYNNRRQSFPAVLAAASLGFGPIELFNMPETEREVPKVALR